MATEMSKWRGISIPEPIAEELERLGNDPYIRSTYGVNGVPEIVRRACTMLIKTWRGELEKNRNQEITKDDEADGE